MVLVLSLLPVHSLFAETPEEKGLAIAKEADRRDTGFGDSTANLVMVLKNRQGQSSTRYLRIQTLEVENDGDKSLSIFDKPRDIKGTALLSFSHKVGTDDQWLYLPALKRVKRISSANKSGAFVGSEFAYEDLSSQEVEKYTYKYIKDDTINGLPAFVIERDPVDENSGYTRQVVWIDKAEYRVQKIDFYDRKNVLLKTLTLSDYEQFLNRYWRAHSFKMQNHQNGKSTELTWSDYKFKVGLTDRDFNRSTLKRAR
jgi:outer membrane lipoprotein-sorting protein